MIENVNASLVYTCSNGEEYNLMQEGVRVLSGSMHTWERSPVESELIYGSKVTAVGKAAATYSVQIILGGPESSRKAFLNAFHRALEYDLANNTPGTLSCGEWHIDAFGISSATTPNSTNSKTLNTVNFYCPSPFWLKTDSIIIAETTTSEDPTGLDFPFDFPFDFTASLSRTDNFNIESLIPSDFIMRIYGPIANPTIKINGYLYGVDIEIESGGYVEIDSAKRTVFKYDRTGTKINVFFARRKDTSVFEPIPGGSISVVRNGTYRVEIDVQRKRDEPEWN